MTRDPRALLWDARASADAIVRFLSGKSFDDYLADEILRSAVERQFEILGEALAQLSKADSKLAARVPNAGNAIGFRNVLIHGYAKVDSAIVWQAATQALPKLRSAVDALLRNLGDTP
ncbi:MAG: HepT-like ribonuclease domain-containing protein [Pseudomonadota bacterium]|nr:HepT-like ribonuclease domain-containing protein [Pseudomonadota bacterium]